MVSRSQKAMPRAPSVPRLARAQNVESIAAGSTGVSSESHHASNPMRAPPRNLAEASRASPSRSRRGVAHGEPARSSDSRNLQEGAPADLVAYERNPLEDLEALSAPSVIVLDGGHGRRGGGILFMSLVRSLVWRPTVRGPRSSPRPASRLRVVAPLVQSSGRRGSRRLAS